jgi:threonine aldolase
MSRIREKVDLRSDTVTLPSSEMRLAMANAPVGDDVMGEDPTVNKLEDYSAELLGKQAAVFVPSGTMANQIAVRVYGHPGDEILTVDETHVFFYEAGSAAGVSGVQLHVVPSQAGIFSVHDFRLRIRGDDPHFPRTKAFWIENTHNRGGGRIVPLRLLKELSTLSRETKIPIHMDGARLANAAVATGIPLKKWASLCNSLSLCFSKGLGAPIGSILAGTREFINEARRARKALGGGMRQAGIVAAGALYALKNNVERLSEDHRRAKDLLDGLREIKGLEFPLPVETNMVMIDLDPSAGMDASQAQHKLEDLGIELFAVRSHRLRAVIHLNINDEDVSRTVAAFKKLLSKTRHVI